MANSYSRAFRLLLGAMAIFTQRNSFSQKLAFPTAEGYSKYTVGGARRYCKSVNGDFNTNNGNITIARQTSSGDVIS